MNGFKVVVMIFILFGHRFMFLAGNPMTYPEFYEQVSKKKKKLFLK